MLIEKPKVKIKKMIYVQIFHKTISKTLTPPLPLVSLLQHTPNWRLIK